MAQSNRFALWAGMLALTGCWFCIFGGFCEFFYKGGTGYAVYSVVVGFVLAFFFFPVKFLGKAILLFHLNYYVSAVVIWAFSILLFFTVPTTLAGIVWLMAGVSFVAAGYRKEALLTVPQLLGQRGE